MSIGNPARLLKLADREFHQLSRKAAVPVPTRKFRLVSLNPEKFLSRLGSEDEEQQCA